VNDLLRALLPALQEAARRTLRPEDLDAIVVHNAGPIPPVHPGSHEPGFNVVIAERGRPIYFCKCRPSGHAALAHEGAISAILARDPTTARHVAATHFERGSAMDVLVVQRLPGRPYYELLVKQTDADWLASVALVVGLAETMAAVITGALPALRRSETVRLLDEGQWALSALETEQGLARHRVDALAAALEAGGEVDAPIQHGDLWPPNVLVEGTSWYILDLELFGRVRVPLYDVLHMLHNCSEVRRSGTADVRPWIRRLVEGDAAERGSRALIARAADRYRLTRAGAFGALVYYVVDVAARVRARGAWSSDWRGYLAQAACLADLIAEGAATPDSLVTADRG
jgi:hypothetical protein